VKLRAISDIAVQADVDRDLIEGIEIDIAVGHSDVQD
jgi:hypothetical protein